MATPSEKNDYRVLLVGDISKAFSDAEAIEGPATGFTAISIMQ